jgi:hypothetical protein
MHLLGYSGTLADEILNNAERRHMMQEELTAANFEKSDLWHEVEYQYLHVMLDHDYCVACGLRGEGLLQVHQIVPVEFCFLIGREDLTVNPLNMVTLCEGQEKPNNHHVTLGHLGDFHWYNPDVHTDITGPWKDLHENAIKEQFLEEWTARRDGAVKFPPQGEQLDQLNTSVLQTFGPKPPGTWQDFVELHFKLRTSINACV